MKTIPPGIDLTASDLSLAMGVKLTLKNGAMLGFTNHDQNVTIEGLVYKASTGFFRNALSAQNKMSVPNMELIGFLDDDAITEVDLRAGRYQDARVNLLLYDWQQPEEGYIKLPGSGWLGNIKYQTPNKWTATIIGLAQAYQTNEGNLYQPDCRNDLGDLFCQVDLDDFRQAGTVVSVSNVRTTFFADPIGAPFNTTTRLLVPTWQSRHRYFPQDAMRLGSDTTFFYVCVQANSFAGGNVPKSGNSAPSPASNEGDTITDGDLVWKATLHDWYFEGRLVWTSGPNQAYPGVIRAYTVGTPAEFELQSSTPFPIAIGHTFSVEAGCGKQFYVCRSKFDNALNHNGEKDAPGQEAYLDYPDAEQ